MRPLAGSKGRTMPLPSRFVTLLATLFVLTVVTFGAMALLLYRDEKETEVLPLVAIGGVVVLITILTTVAMTFSALQLTDPAQPLGLPDGSIRAVIALSLVVLFAIFTIFLYRGVFVGGPKNTILLSEAEMGEFFKRADHLREIRATPAMDKTDKLLTNSEGKPLYEVNFREGETAASVDFAKHLVVLLGTLMTAVTSFYLGAGTATSAATGTARDPPPTVTDIDPTVHSIANDGTEIHLRVMGSNLNTITHVKIVRAGAQVIGRNVASNPTSVTCDIPVSAATTPPGGEAWDVVVDDGASKSATLPTALTINA